MVHSITLRVIGKFHQGFLHLYRESQKNQDRKKFDDKNTRGCPQNCVQPKNRTVEKFANQVHLIGNVDG